MNENNKRLVAEMIAKVESNCRWGAYSPPGNISDRERTITIGAYQFGGGSNEARDLLLLIKKDYPEVFKTYDNCGLSETLTRDWYSSRFNPSDLQKSSIIKIITSAEGIESQKKYFCQIELPKYLKHAEEFGIKTQKCQALWVEIEHLGGLNPTKRIFGRISSETIDEVDRSLKKDWDDKSNNNQVGDWIYYKDRHSYCIAFVRDNISEDKSVSEERKIYMEKIVFETKDVSRGSKGNTVLLLQEILKSRGFKGKDGKDLKLDKDCGENTEFAINEYQEARRKMGVELGLNGKNDGICGQKMWKDLIAI